MSVGGKRVFGSAESCSRRDWAFPAIGDWWAISITEVSARRAGMPANGHCMESCRSVLSVGRICIADLVFWFLAPHELRNGRWLYSVNGGYNACPDESERTEAPKLVRTCQLINGQKNANDRLHIAARITQCIIKVRCFSAPQRHRLAMDVHLPEGTGLCQHAQTANRFCVREASNNPDPGGP